jgi:DNA-binding response OmpR family regulator
MMPPARAGPCILVVDDEDGTRLGLERWLSHDYDVITARDGAQGLLAASARTPPPDVVLTDVWMPALDGVSMVKRMKQDPRLREIPVIFLTGQTSARSMVAGIAAGARAYLCKPIDLDTLDRKIANAIASRRRPTPRRGSEPYGVRGPLLTHEAPPSTDAVAAPAAGTPRRSLGAVVAPRRACDHLFSPAARWSFLARSPPDA